MVVLLKHADAIQPILSVIQGLVLVECVLGADEQCSLTGCQLFFSSVIAHFLCNFACKLACGEYNESGACVFENLASFYLVKKLKSIQDFRNSSKNHY